MHVAYITGAALTAFAMLTGIANNAFSPTARIVAFLTNIFFLFLMVYGALHS